MFHLDRHWQVCIFYHSACQYRLGKLATQAIVIIVFESFVARTSVKIAEAYVAVVGRHAVASTWVRSLDMVTQHWDIGAYVIYCNVNMNK